MSGADRQQQTQSTPPSADQLRLFLQSMQQQFQATQHQNNSAPTKAANSNTNTSEKQSPALDENNVFDMLMQNPEYQRMINYSQMGQAAAQSAPMQHPLAAAASNPENPAFRALLAHSSANPGMPPFGVYPNFGPEMHPEMLAANPYYANGMPFGAYMGGMDAGRRKNATREVTMPLKKWLNDHRKYPYPNKAEKMILAIITKMSLTQVSTWFANARRRLKKENKMTWSPRCRPGEDDDDEDDLADADNEPLSPSISINSSDEPKRDGNSFEEQKGIKRHAESNNDDSVPTPKRKTLSVNDMLSSSRQSPSRGNDKCKSPRSTTPPSSSSNGTAAENTPNMMPGMLPMMGQFPPVAGGFPFPFLPGANPAQAWNPQMMAMLAAMPQNAARNPATPFNTIPPMNPNFLQQVMAMQQMANFMRNSSSTATPAMPPQLNPAMLAAMQGFFPSTSAAPTSTNSSSSPSTKLSASNRPSSTVNSISKPSEQPQSPSVVNTSSSSVSEGTLQVETTTNSAATTKEEPIKNEDVDSSPQQKPVAAH